MGKIINPETGKPTFLRNFSFMATESDLILLKRGDILKWVLNPPEPPFIFAVTYGGKKHIAFKSRIAENREYFIITTDTGDVYVDRLHTRRVVDVIQPWYAIIPEKAQTEIQPTWFTKGDILYGCKRNKRIEDYGIEKYMNENKQIEHWRGTPLLRLLVFVLNKRESI